MKSKQEYFFKSKNRYQKSEEEQNKKYLVSGLSRLDTIVKVRNV